jgi:general stress protein YciG
MASVTQLISSIPAMKEDEEQESRVSRRGFAAMDRTRQREIASRGGRAAHARGTAHQWSAEEAREAGRRGGLARAQKQEE